MFWDVHRKAVKIPGSITRPIIGFHNCPNFTESLPQSETLNDYLKLLLSDNFVSKTIAKDWAM